MTTAKPRDPAVWLTGVVLGAGSVAESELAHLVCVGTVEGSEGSYPVFTKDGSPLVLTEEWKLYAAQLPGQMGFMKIACTPAQNGILEREVRVLQALQDKAEEIDTKADKPYNYGAFIPRVMESFVSGDGRTVVILGFHPSISSYKQFIPLPRVLTDRRTDLKTAVWLLGKPLKVLDFLHHLNGYLLGMVDGSNMLLETDQHGVLYLDLSHAEENPSEEEQGQEVAAATKIVWEAVGGHEDVDPPYDQEIMVESQHTEFVAFLKRVMEDPRSAIEEHTALYELANRIWPPKPKTQGEVTVTKRDFHSFSTYPR